jgi:hypothetical protein
LQSSPPLRRVAELGALGGMTRRRDFWFVVGLVAGVTIGALAARFNARLAVLSGPYSDDYAPARTAIARATERLRTGDTNVFEDLQTADTHLSNAQRWANRFMGETDNAK